MVKDMLKRLEKEKHLLIVIKAFVLLKKKSSGKQQCLSILVSYFGFLCELLLPATLIFELLQTTV